MIILKNKSDDIKIIKKEKFHNPGRERYVLSSKEITIQPNETIIVSTGIEVITSSKHSMEFVKHNIDSCNIDMVINEDKLEFHITNIDGEVKVIRKNQAIGVLQTTTGCQLKTDYDLIDYTHHLTDDLFLVNTNEIKQIKSSEYIVDANGEAILVIKF